LLRSEDLDDYHIWPATLKEVVADSTEETANSLEKAPKDKAAEPMKKVTDPKAKTGAAAQPSMSLPLRIAQPSKEVTLPSALRITLGASSEHVSVSINSSPLVKPVDIDHLLIGCATALPIGVAPEAMLNCL
jgi:hypothetical protein